MSLKNVRSWGVNFQFHAPKKQLCSTVLSFIVDQLEELFKDKEANFTEIYKLFSDAFVFIPCTAEEYRELEAAGLN